MSTLHEDVCNFMTVPGWILLRMINVPDKIVEKIKHTHFMFSNFLFRKFWLLWNIVEKYCTAGQVTDDNITRRMRTACWITKATNAQSEYVIGIAVSLQKCLQGHVSILRYTYIACLVQMPVLCCLKKFWSQLSNDVVSQPRRIKVSNWE